MHGYTCFCSRAHSETAPAPTATSRVNRLLPSTLVYPPGSLRMRSVTERVDVVGRQLFGDHGCQGGAGFAAVIFDVGVDHNDHRGLLLRQVDRNGLIAGQAAVVS